MPLRHFASISEMCESFAIILTHFALHLSRCNASGFVQIRGSSKFRKLLIQFHLTAREAKEGRMNGGRVGALNFLQKICPNFSGGRRSAALD
jgi:hypothetical protein